jgi:hypothetical protein
VLQKKTVFVIGAGASKEANLPTGDELTGQIAQLVDLRFEYSELKHGNPKFWDELRATARAHGQRDLEAYVHACRLIKSAMPQAMSIDNFIHIHRGNKSVEICGKLAIALCVLQAERQSNLYIDRGNIYNKLNFDGLGRTWFNSFIKLLTEYRTLAELAEVLPRLTFIIFNYDRCIEHFLFHSIQNVYGADANTARDLMAKISVFHPYGVVGPLEWQGSANYVEFGADLRYTQLSSIAGNIKTFTEGAAQESADGIRGALCEGATVVFLGFAFHPLNMELLFGLRGSDSRRVNVYGTALNLSKADCALVNAELVSRFNCATDEVHLDREATCSKLFLEYWRSLSQD